jgi:hypothetical protein
VVEMNGGDDAYILVENSEENRKKLNAVGVTDETITRYGDDKTFCILALAFNEGYADEYRDGKLVLWGPIDDELRSRVLNGEGTPADAERLLEELERLSALRDPVRWFAWEMEKQLRANEHKGGWENETFEWLYSEMKKNVTVLAVAQSPEEKIRRAANIANFAMMIADQTDRSSTHR